MEVDFAFAPPKGPYTDRAMMLMMFPISVGGTPVKLGRLWRALDIYDLPYLAVPDLHRTYWRSILLGLAAMRELTKEEPDRFIPLYVENVIRETTSGKVQTSRTGDYPHGQVIAVDREAIIPGGKKFSHLEEEQIILARRDGMVRFVGELKEEMSRPYKFLGVDEFKPDLKDVQYGIKEKLPLGYFLEFPAFLDTQDSFRETVERTAEVAASNFIAYEKLSKRYQSTTERLFSQIKIIPQPSYRMYVSLGNGSLSLIYSPEFLSHAGVMEAAGISLIRDQNVPRRYSKEEVEDFQNKFVGLVKEYEGLGYIPDLRV